MNIGILRGMFWWCLILLLSEVVGCGVNRSTGEAYAITEAQARNALLKMAMASENMPKEFVGDLQEKRMVLWPGIVEYGRWACFLGKLRWMVYEQREFEDGRGYRNEWTGKFVIDSGNVVRAEIEEEINADW